MSPTAKRRRPATPSHIDGLYRDTCRDCGRPVVAGRVLLDHRAYDETPLTALGELLVRISGGQTWTAMAHGLTLRAASEITHTPPGGYSASHHSSDYDVIATHQCATQQCGAGVTYSRITKGNEDAPY